MDIASWLTSLGLGEYAPVFRDNHIDAEVLPSLRVEDLTALGITSVGHRRKLLNAIGALAGRQREVPTAHDDAGLGRTPAEELSPDWPVAEAVTPPAERRQLTVMFVDLVGSTELSQRLDPEDMREVILAYQQAVSRAIGRYEGRVAKLMGDGVLAYFGWPQAHEDDAERAVRAGLAAASATASLTAPGGESLYARIGIATGLVVVGDLIGEGAAQEEAVVGDTPNLAARLQALAEPGSVVVSHATQRLVAGLFETTSLGDRQLKGFAAPVRAWQITGEAAVEGRFAARHGVLAPIVGREKELALLLERWHRATAGAGQVVVLSARRASASRGWWRRLQSGSTPNHMPNCAIFARPITQTAHSILSSCNSRGRLDSSATTMRMPDSTSWRHFSEDLARASARHFRCLRHCCRLMRRDGMQRRICRHWH